MVATTGHLTLKDIAELAQVSRPAVSNWRKRYSDFPAPLETSAPNKPLFEAADVVSWLKANEFLPGDAEKNLQPTSLWAAANLLRNEIAIDDIPLIMLTLLAIDKDPVFKPSAEFDALSSRISTAKLEEVQQAISRLHLADHGEAAQLVVDRFLGIGSRGDRSQYGTAASLSSAAIVAAASSTHENAETVLDPACGIAGTLLGVGSHFPKAQLLGTEINASTASLARLLTYLTGNEATIETANSLMSDQFPDVRADIVVCEPPLAVRFHKSDLEEMQRNNPEYPLRGLGSEELFILYAAQHLTEKGRAYLITSMRPTYHGGFKEHRQRLIAQGQIEAVVELPRGVFSATRIPVALWVLRAEGAEEPLLIDASSQSPDSVPSRIGKWLNAARSHETTDVTYQAVTLADVVTNDGSLSPSIYLTEPIALDDAAIAFDTALHSLNTTTKDLSHMRTPRITASTVPTATSSTMLADLIKDGHFERINGRYRANKELQSGDVHLARPNRSASPAFVDEFNATDVLHPGDILMPRIGELPAWVHEEDGKKWVASDALIVLRPASNEYDPYFIAACLNAPTNISTQGMIAKRHQLARLTIPELNREQRSFIAEAHRSLNNARMAARQLEHEAEQASDALLNLVFAGK